MIPCVDKNMNLEHFDLLLKDIGFVKGMSAVDSGYPSVGLMYSWIRNETSIVVTVGPLNTVISKKNLEIWNQTEYFDSYNAVLESL